LEYSWDIVESLLDVMGYHKKIRIEASEIEIPGPENGFVERVGEPEFQLKDLRKTINGKECIHIQVFEGYYAVHRDKVDPDIDPAGHLIQDAPEIPIALVIGGVIGYAAGSAYYDKVKDASKHPILESVLVGLGSGGGAAALSYLLGKYIREQIE